MIDTPFHVHAPGLLVSVRNATEALTALSAGADVIDVKEPDRGPLGAADTRTVNEIVQAIADRAPVTMAMGELLEFAADDNSRQLTPIPSGVALFKFGLAGCRQAADWQSRWRIAVSKLTNETTVKPAQPVAVVYADWKTAGAPKPEHVLSTGAKLGCPALLVDTWGKSTGSLFDYWPRRELRKFINQVRARDMLVVLAGSISAERVQEVIELRTDLVAVRGAACDAGRGGTISADRVRRLKQLATPHTNSAAQCR